MILTPFRSLSSRTPPLVTGIDKGKEREEEEGERERRGGMMDKSEIQG